MAKEFEREKIRAICITESLCCIPETNTIVRLTIVVNQLYTNTKEKALKNVVCVFLNNETGTKEDEIQKVYPPCVYSVKFFFLT